MSNSTTLQIGLVNVPTGTRLSLMEPFHFTSTTSSVPESRKPHMAQCAASPTINMIRSTKNALRQSFGLYLENSVFLTYFAPFFAR